jgi:hypothetical protein
MAFDLNDIELDLSLSDDGVEIEVGDGAYITIGRWGSRRFKRAVNKYAGNKFAQIQKRMGNRRKLNGEQAEKDEQEAAEIMARVMADSVLLGWRGLTYKGETMEYSPDQAVRVLKDEKFEDFREFVELSAKDEENFRAKKIEEDAGNLPSGSGTASE